MLATRRGGRAWLASALLALLGLSWAFPAPLAAAQAVQPPAVGASAQVVDRSGRVLATATFREAADQVLINLAFPDRQALVGTHAIQIHDTGRCDPPDFASAGAILNPAGKQHGLLNPDGPMAGDLPSLTIGPAGVSSYNLAAPLVKLTSGPAALLRAGGTSLVIFEAVDDDLSQPEGNAGARIACGAIVSGAPVAGAPPAGVSSAASSTTGPDGAIKLALAGLGVVLVGIGLVLRRA